MLRVCVVRRQNIRHSLRRKLAEGGPRLGLVFRRRAYGVASADVRWFGCARLDARLKYVARFEDRLGWQQW